ncbi:DUF3179 domain-containing protein [Sulfidibacter corallicola]|uniref:DUF3179 domain-containing protein n=2 Tax=Sulfidibacter corallicola TaxID=2818388 RepID=A0A8A4TPN9_SULCO|nr:DUF3179 domain-containing protein [Sulfidibacter corallicola]
MSRHAASRLAPAILTLLLFSCLPFKPWGGPGEVRHRDLPKLKRLAGDPVRRLGRPDSIPSLDDPRFVPGAEADFMQDHETVLGVVHHGQAKAYSLWHLDRHEIVNDVVGETPVAVTW